MLTNQILFTKSPERFIQGPSQYPPITELYEKHVSVFWTHNEVASLIADDIKDFAKLTPQEQFYIKNILGFFATADNIVNTNLALNFYSEIQVPEILDFWSFQIAIENIHAKTYSLLVESYVPEPAEQREIFRAHMNPTKTKLKTEWCAKYMDPSLAEFADRLIAFAVVEGVFFSSSFCAIFWFNRRSILKGLCKSNEFIARDEGMHCDFACLLYRMLETKSQNVEKIVREAVEIECEFVSEILPEDLIGMKAETMQQYVKYTADRLLVNLGQKQIYNVTNPFEWMEVINLERKSNFFETPVTEYSKKKKGTPIAYNEDC